MSYGKGGRPDLQESLPRSGGREAVEGPGAPPARHAPLLIAETCRPDTWIPGEFESP